MAKFFLIAVLSFGFTGLTGTAIAGGTSSPVRQSVGGMSVSEMEQAAKAAYAKKDYKTTTDLLTAINKADPNNVLPYLGFAAMLNDLGEHGQALETAKKGLEVHPNNSELWCEAGIAQWKLGDREKARTLLIKAIDVKNTNKLPYNLLIAMCNEEGDTERAAKVAAIRDQYCK